MLMFNARRGSGIMIIVHDSLIVADGLECFF